MFELLPSSGPLFSGLLPTSIHPPAPPPGISLSPTLLHSPVSHLLDSSQCPLYVFDDQRITSSSSGHSSHVGDLTQHDTWKWCYISQPILVLELNEAERTIMSTEAFSELAKTVEGRAVTGDYFRYQL